MSIFNFSKAGEAKELFSSDDSDAKKKVWIKFAVVLGGAAVIIGIIKLVGGLATE